MVPSSSTVIHETPAFGMKDVETVGWPRVTCDFALPNCDHAAVFDDVYLRTNRTNHTKIMRCFPHCCPLHRERSYCGSSVHVMVRSTADVKRDQLVVYGRFRPMHTEPLARGTRLTNASVEASLQSKDPSKGQWIESKATRNRHGSDPGSQHFEINPSGRWYYPWSGAATIAMRLIEHIFEAHVFRRVGSELELVALIGSTTFRLMSFRRGSSTALKEDTEALASNDAPKKRKAITRAPSPTDATEDGLSPPGPNHLPVSHPMVVSGSVLRSSISNDATNGASTTRLPPLQPQLTQSPPQSTLYQAHHAIFPDVQLPPQRQLLNHPLHHQVQALAVPLVGAASAPYAMDSTLSTLLQWLQELPANSVGSRYMLAWESIVQEACEAQVTASRDRSSTRSDLVPILSALDVSVPPASSTTGAVHQQASPLDTIDTVVRLLLHLWLDVGSTSATNKAVDRCLRDGFRPDDMALASAHSSWLARLHARAQRFVREESSVDWAQLASMSTSQPTQHRATGNSDAHGFRWFAAQCRERYVNRLRGHRARESHKRQRMLSVPPGLENSARVWTSRMEDMSVAMDGINEQAPSLLTVVQFWKHLGCLRLDFAPGQDVSGTPPELSAASVFNSLVSDGSFTKLMLDGQYRWFNCLPSGESTIGTTLMGYVVGDYVGRATSTGTIHITTYLWPATVEGSSATAFAWHWTIDASSLSSGSNSSVVSVVVESASVGRSPHAMETMSMAEKLRYVGHWQHASELRLSYKC